MGCIVGWRARYMAGRVQEFEQQVPAQPDARRLYLYLRPQDELLPNGMWQAGSPAPPVHRYHPALTVSSRVVLPPATASQRLRGTRLYERTGRSA